jgi:DNA-directed RNA polymerase specialized sigma24 family protein
VIRNRSAVAAHRESKRVQCEALSPICDGFDPDQNERVDSARANREPASADPTASLVLSADVQRVIAKLPDNLRNLALDLTYLSPAEAAAKSNRTRQRIHQLMGNLRTVFLNSGILPEGLCSGGAR